MMKPLLVGAGVTVVLFASMMFGALLATLHHTADYQSGWNAGYAARTEQAQEDDHRFQVVGLCVYAQLACTGRNK